MVNLHKVNNTPLPPSKKNECFKSVLKAAPQHSKSVQN